MKYIIPILLTLLSACTTPYKPQEGNSSGYSDMQVNTDAFIVGFKGGKPLATKELALLRAAEVALTNGYGYFVVAQVDDLSTVHTHNSPYVYVPYSYWPYQGSYTYTVKTPHYVYTIICYSVRPATPSYDARMVVQNISAKHGLLE